jgi:hypothetical protein
MKACSLAFRDGTNAAAARLAAVMTLVFAGTGVVYFVVLYLIAG